MVMFSLLSFRVVKEEIVDEDAKLPCFNGRVVSWVSTFKNLSLATHGAASEYM